MTAEVVIDNSALIEFLTVTDHDVRLRRRILTSRAAAPELLDAVLEAPIARTGHRALARRALELRDAITACDALYVALAEQLNVPLVTCDAKLARSNGHQARIELYPKRS